jgi:hypothetical protein
MSKYVYPYTTPNTGLEDKTSQMTSHMRLPVIYLRRTITEWCVSIQSGFKFTHNVLISAQKTLLTLRLPDVICLAILMILGLSTAYNLPVWIRHMCGPDYKVFKRLGIVWIHLFPAQLSREEQSKSTVCQVFKAAGYTTQAISEMVVFTFHLCVMIVSTPFCLLGRLFPMHQLLSKLLPQFRRVSMLASSYTCIDPLALRLGLFWGLGMLMICVVSGINVVQLSGTGVVGVCFIIGLASKQPKRMQAHSQSTVERQRTKKSRS